MQIEFRSAWITTAMTLFFEQFSRETYTESGFTEEVKSSFTQATYRFESDTLIWEVRCWAGAALSCGIISSFTVVA